MRSARVPSAVSQRPPAEGPPRVPPAVAQEAGAALPCRSGEYGGRAPADGRVPHAPRFPVKGRCRPGRSADGRSGDQAGVFSLVIRKNFLTKGAVDVQRIGSPWGRQITSPALKSYS